MIYVDLCPMCGVLREMDVTGFQTAVVDADGRTIELLTRAFHCKACTCFVRSDEVLDVPEHREDVRLDDPSPEGVDAFQAERTAEGV
ncbi:MAG TPA: hypothetical protein VII11_06795 [Bacteroidota bacterium]